MEINLAVDVLKQEWFWGMIAAVAGIPASVAVTLFSVRRSAQAANAQVRVAQDQARAAEEQLRLAEEQLRAQWEAPLRQDKRALQEKAVEEFSKAAKEFKRALTATFDSFMKGKLWPDGRTELDDAEWANRFRVYFERAEELWEDLDYCGTEIDRQGPGSIMRSTVQVVDRGKLALHMVNSFEATVSGTAAHQLAQQDDDTRATVLRLTVWNFSQELGKFRDETHDCFNGVMPKEEDEDRVTVPRYILDQFINYIGPFDERHDGEVGSAEVEEYMRWAVGRRGGEARNLSDFADGEFSQADPNW